jgi:hypothetical protein
MKVKEIITQVVILRLLVIQRQAKLAYISFGYAGWQWPKFAQRKRLCGTNKLPCINIGLQDKW